MTGEVIFSEDQEPHLIQPLHVHHLGHSKVRLCRACLFEAKFEFTEIDLSIVQDGEGWSL